jgi:phenylacetate-CoA ligase
MSAGIRRPWQAVDYAELTRRYPPPPEYFERAHWIGPEEIERLQLARLRDRAERAYRVPFFRRRWDEAGVGPGDLRELADLWRFPTYTVDDLRKSIEHHPPYGDYQGVTPADALREPMRVYMSGGTTGKSRPTFYTQWDREVGAVLTARGAYMQGIRPGDVVLNSWAYGLHNGAFGFDEGLHRWLNCVVLTTSTGTVTSTRRQLELAREYRASAILTTGDYLLRIVDEARAAGLDPAKDLAIRSLATNIGNEEVLQELFGVEAFATYGFHEVQYVAVECEAHDGLHVFEDAFVVQVVDPESGQPLPDGQTGALVVTELYKTGSPQFRYNIMDLSFLYPRERCRCGSWMRRIGRFAGRGDNMVKLRGVNLWPEAVGRLATALPGTTPDYFVRALRRGGRDELIVAVVSDRPPAEWPELRAQIERRLKDELGVRIEAEIAAPGALDALTEIASSPKPKRFRDERRAR